MGKTILTFLLILLAIFGVTAIIQEKNKGATLAGMQGNAISMVAQEAETLKDEAKTKGSALAEATKVKAEAVGKDIKTGAANLAEETKAAAARAGEKAHQLGEKVTESAETVTEKTQKAIHEQQVKQALSAKPNLGKQWKVVSKADKPNSWKVKNLKTGKLYRVSSQMMDSETKKTTLSEFKTNKVFKEFTSKVQ